jgi:hypothetical protein
VRPMPQECRAEGTRGSSSSAPHATEAYPRHACSIAARTAACRSGCRSCASRNGRRRPAGSVALGSRRSEMGGGAVAGGGGGGPGPAGGGSRLSQVSVEADAEKASGAAANKSSVSRASAREAPRMLWP